MGAASWCLAVAALMAWIGAPPARAQARSAAKVQTVCTGDRVGQLCMPMICDDKGVCHVVSPPSPPHPSPPTPEPPKLMSWADLYGRIMPKPTERIAYGPGSQQFGELWRPDGRGPHPAVVMIHGGCWTKSVAKLNIDNFAAEDLRRRGVAVWNIEYRGVDEPGGGYPGTFQDVAAALDAFPKIARDHGLKADRVVVIGHSAGGHLTLWAAARPKLPADSPLHSADPLKIDVAISLAGILDLQHDLTTACGAEPIQAMTGAPAPGRRDIYADTSPSALLPIGVRQVIVNGERDHTVQPEIAQRYAALAKAAGDPVSLHLIPGAHVEVIAPGTAAWTEIVRLVQEALAGGG